MEIVVNKYGVRIYNRDNDLRGSTSVIAASEEEAINLVRADNRWYDEGTGYDYKPLKYPLTFKATIITQ